jgi:asparagine synthase (glutamine-hydrolysing)
VCGIAGTLRFDGTDADLDVLARMADEMAHRGPDDLGFHRDGPLGIAFRRLAIVDLVTGHQPLGNEDGDVWAVLNGEIYNHRELRASLTARGHTFRTTSDTEVLVHLYEDHGPELVTELAGMFALAVWDARRRRLLLARDRVGIKPLYYATSPEGLVFASEARALLAAEPFARDLDLAAVDRFLAHYYLPGPDTLLRGVRRLPPGTFLVAEGDTVRTSRYWRAEIGARPRPVGLDEAVDELDALLDEVVEQHLLSDVPLGFLLSGGLDSSVVLAVAARHLTETPRTFTVGFDAPGVVDERPYARRVAEHFGCEHHEISVHPDDFWDFLAVYVRHMEDPVCEPPAIALAAVAELARRHVTVVLSGEGGDEAFAGYANYRWELLAERVRRLAGPLARTAGPPLGRALERTGRAATAGWGDRLAMPLGQRYLSRTSSPAHYFARHRAALYGDDLLAASNEASRNAPVSSALAAAAGRDPLSRMLQVDLETWLPDDLLVKADKMTMLHSIELRVPLLDHRVLEWAGRLPTPLKLEGRTTKRVLRELGARILPREVVERPKAGFPVPYATWLRTSLRTRVEELLLGPDSRLRAQLRPDGIADLLRAHDATGRLGKEVFALVVLELWQREFLPDDGGAGPASPQEPHPMTSVHKAGHPCAPLRVTAQIDR